MPSTDVTNPVLSRDSIQDLNAGFVADPFVVRTNGTWHMFFEVWNRKTGKGEIGLATSTNGFKWTYHSIVVSEPFHLSYPYVFEWENQFYMLPECGSTGSVRLYIAERFPSEWRHVATLLEGHGFLDPSIMRWEDRWWLFSEASSQGTHDTLRLYYADSLYGPWSEHLRSPLIQENPHVARPAGRVIARNGNVVRFCQDCYPRYGMSVSAFLVTELSPSQYEEAPLQDGPILAASGAGWNALGMHHIDPHRMENGAWIAFVDGRIDLEE